MVVITEDIEQNIESMMEEVGDGNTEFQINYLQMAPQLLEKLENAATGKGDGADRALSELLKFASNEVGIEKEEQHESDLKVYSRKKVKEQHESNLRVYSRKKVKLENAEEVACGELIRLKSHIPVCDHSCCSHEGKMLMDIWSFMPSDLLHLVFAHLPVDEISRLRILNKEWMQIISDPDCEFYQHCDAVQPKIMCLLAKDPLRSNKFWVRAYDLKRGTWCSYEIFAGYPEYLIWTLACEAEGLLCFTAIVNESPWEDVIFLNQTIFLNVVNPLRRASHELPPVVGMRSSIFQMKVDTTTKQFQVYVVGERLNGRNWNEPIKVEVQIFDSLTNKWNGWTQPKAQQLPKFVFGLRGGTFAIYNCENRQFVDLAADESSPLNGTFVSASFYQDRVFMLQKGNDGPSSLNAPANLDEVKFYIEEWQYCQAPEDRHSWLRKDSYRCRPFERPPKAAERHCMRLFASKGLLMVLAELTPYNTRGRFTNKRLAWLYDLYTRKWSVLDLPKLPEIERNLLSETTCDQVQLICEPHWTV